ncbi:hypothetical protein ACFC1T_08245 [Kitasatospora sp. NPDC056076]|uniref:hypothetical protein n=1 Tax=Kitasatospora sp. NPDC056076 TaxID=3345703 RepID=UPI0035DA0EB4
MAAVAALIPLLTAWYPAIPWEALVAAAAALFGVGEIAQRHEDGKTLAALNEPAPRDRAADLQAALTKLEAEQVS